MPRFPDSSPGSDHHLTWPLIYPSKLEMVAVDLRLSGSLRQISEGVLLRTGYGWSWVLSWRPQRRCESHSPEKWGYLRTQASVGRGREEKRAQLRTQGTAPVGGGLQDVSVGRGKGSEDSLHGSRGRWD